MDTKTTEINGEEVLWRKAMSLDGLEDSQTNYTGFNPHTEVLPKGWQKRPDRLAIPCDIQFTQDTAVELRDGTKLYADIFLPTDGGKYPTIVSWSPYGKNGSGFEAELDIDGVDMQSISGLQKFEACDPAYWCNQGYALVNPDSRGAYMSEGDMHFWGTQDGRDAYDVVEWIAAQPWSNGKVAFAGNSWLAVAQYFVAQEQPPHLTCIAPWEGQGDLLGDDMLRGGIPDPMFNSLVVTRTPGNNFIQDTPNMSLKYPYYNGFWKDKVPVFEKIRVPAYIVASYNSPVHVHGSFECFRRANTEEKWLRIHNTGEWADFYEPAHQADLQKFFDYYMKGVDNGWPNTPKVRMSVIDPGGEDVVDRPESEYPPARTAYHTLYLTADGKLEADAPSAASVLSYDTTDKGAKLTFTHTFDSDTEYSGYAKLRLWVEAEDADDMDIHVDIAKLDAVGKPLIQKGIGAYSGPSGKLRVSRRKLDEARSTESEPVLMLDNSSAPLSPGEIVPVDISILPTGLLFHKGEQLCITIRHTGISLMGPPSGDTPIGPTPTVDIPHAGFDGPPPAGMDGPPDGLPAGGNPFGSGAAPYFDMPPALTGSNKFHFGGQYPSYFYFPTV